MSKSTDMSLDDSVAAQPACRNWTGRVPNALEAVELFAVRPTPLAPLPTRKGGTVLLPLSSQERGPGG